MGFSPLCTYTRLSPNCTHPRNHAVDRITPHVIVGQCTAKQAANLSRFVNYNGKTGASCNYAIGRDGDYAGLVDENDRSWCTSSRENDHRAITFEIASDPRHPYAITDAAYRAMLDLMTDICKRYGKTKLLWLGSKEATLAYTPAADEMVLTAHRWFAPKACPGDYLYSRYEEIASEVTRRLAAPAATTTQNEDKEEIELKITKEELRALIKDVVVEVYNELNPVIQDIKDVPDYWQPIAQKLLDEEAINGGTERDVCDTDVNLRAETLKAAVIAARFHASETDDGGEQV